MKYAIVPAGIQDKWVRFLNDLMGLPALARGKHVPEVPTELLDGDGRLDLDDSKIAVYQARKARGDLHPRSVALCDALINGDVTPHAAVRYCDPVEHPTNGKLAWPIDAAIEGTYQAHVDAGDLDPGTKQFGDLIAGAADLPVDWLVPAVTEKDKKGKDVEVEPARHKPAPDVKPHAQKQLVKKAKAAPGPKPVQASGKKTP